MNLRRLRDLIVNGKTASTALSKKTSQRRGALWLDMIRCGYKYKMPISQYVKLNFNLLNISERKLLGHESLIEGKKKDLWMKDFLKNRKFFAKYGKQKYELGIYRVLRQRAYSKRYNAGHNLIVESNVYISRQHGLPGKISIGNNCFLAKNCTIDYSGDLSIGNNVHITKGVDIQTHHHLFHSDWKIDPEITESNSLCIGEGAIIGTKAIILPSCHRIGKYARVGAGAVVTKDVPDYAIVVGVPAKIIKIQDP